MNELLKKIDLLAEENFALNKEHYNKAAKLMAIDNLKDSLQVQASISDICSIEWVFRSYNHFCKEALLKIKKQIHYMYEIELLFGKEKESSLKELPEYLIKC